MSITRKAFLVGAVAAGLVILAHLTEAVHRGMIAIPVPATLAPSTTFRCPDPGTVFTYNGTRLASLGEDGFVCRFDTDATHGTEWFGGIMPAMDRADTVGRAIVRGLWPLHVGDRFAWAYVDEQGRPTKARLMVRGYRLLHVPAGWFFVFEIEKSYTRPDYHYVVTHWWAPAVHWNIRQSFHQCCTGPLPFGTAWSLVRVTPAARVPAR